VVLLLAASAGAAGWYLSVGRFTTTPDLSGLTMAQARQQLRSTDLTLRRGPLAYSETVPAGDIVATDPQAGEQVLRDGALTAVVSKGKERYPMPPVVGIGEQQARAALTGGHLQVGEVTGAYSGRVEEGDVIRASQDEGTRLRPGTAVDLVVSKGPRPIDVPDLVGQSRAEARQTLRDRGLDVSVSTEYDDAAPRGEVISQDPDDGTLYRGDRVDLVVSLGPPLVDVPGVFGRYRDNAIDTLEDAGFGVDVQHAGGYVGFDLVASQSPGGSEQAPRGSTVTIYLY
nr:PASTA domain-containing protein [Actinomycetota bacterium]